jgi:SPP1 family predicted phage head-tail adaptor
MYELDAGRLNKRIEIWGYQDVWDDDLGEYVNRLIRKARVWAEIAPSRGYEFLEYYRDTNTLQYKITIRYRKGLTEKDVLVRGDRQFEINSIIDVNFEHQVLEIQCTESKDKVINYEQ